ncbi:aldo/keto reductase [Caldicellulosiruptor saccharolyticus DSM 8903]|uniref:Aldo/keto reductase n=1 Tax=Caldicellulosiruptor saccharolyticus (strain ATCC 43494 / DSM 8903 / Tp8T 6331) TaxID=351627 RepID=A4XKC5_CALS8|nr:aldo/keto reductase [Caldicellulosiruptor saccharolyticus]ABP67360.1 aldo/keto reductase [Caldicellulosiruptor saccharolyticus DSM 8903]
MEYVKLGNTSLIVSKLCFGTLTIGPLQKNLPIEEGAELLAYGYQRGINFVDTAELYDTYKYIKRSIEISGKRPAISTKSYAYDKKTAEASLKKALLELNVDYIDLFMLHEQEGEHTFKGHFEAIEYFLKAKEKGYVKHFGISTHYVKAVRDSLKYPEIEVIHPIFNFKGIGIVDGTIDQMIEAVKEAYQRGKGIFAMKIFGGGNLLSDFKKALEFVFDFPYLHSVAIGMQSKFEIDYNIKCFEEKKVYLDDRLFENIKTKRLHVESWCEGCGRCVNHCHQKALRVEDRKVVVDYTKCLCCGYCSRYCSVFAIKIV